jgi:hypothetical protein
MPASDGRSRLIALIRWLTALHRPSLIAAAIVLIAVVGACNHLTGADISIGVGYLIPVFLAAAAGRGVSSAVVGTASLTWTLIDATLREHLASQPLVMLWNVVARFVVLWLVAALISALAAQLAVERSPFRTDPPDHSDSQRPRSLHDFADDEFERDAAHRSAAIVNRSPRHRRVSNW